MPIYEVVSDEISLKFTGLVYSTQAPYIWSIDAICEVAGIPALQLLGRQRAPLRGPALTPPHNKLHSYPCCPEPRRRRGGDLGSHTSPQSNLNE